MRYFTMVLSVLVLVLGGCNGGNGGGQTNDDTADFQQETEQEVEITVEVEKEVGQETATVVECYNSGDCAEDGILCTMETCVQGKCQHIPNNVSCNDNDACTVDECDKQAGCLHKNLTCDDNDPCTANECHPETGCYFGNANEGACVGLGDECMLAKCVTGIGCEFFEVKCEDGDLDTVDICVVGTGCVHQVVECGNWFSECIASSPCKIVACVSGKCVERDKDCDDNVACTQDFCDTNGACQHIAMSGMCPEDGYMCTQALCQPFFGCGQSSVGCDDNNQCTADSCHEGQGCMSQKIPGCCLDEGDCADGNPCTEDVCGPDHKCGYVPMVCEPDEVGCTVDRIEPLGSQCNCVYEPKDELCGNGLKCDSWKGCVECAQWEDCDDNNPCTIDNCNFKDNGNTCSHDKQCGWQGVHCVVDSEQNQGFLCEDDPGYCNSNWDCDDNNPCTNDICQDNKCTDHEQVQCNPGNLCNVGTCNPETGGCEFKSKCNDGDYCTEDACDDGTGTCTNLPVTGCVVCSEHGDCPQSGTQVCVNEGKSLIYTGECEVWNHRCAMREWLCTDDICNNGWCNPETGGCQFKSKCDDGNACTDDACNDDTGVCSNFGIPGCYPCQTYEDCPVAGTQVCAGGKSVQYQGTCSAWDHRCQTQEQLCTDTPCQTGRCDSQFGTCVYQDRCIPDTDPCTETCIWGTGECNAPVPGCF